MFAVPLHQERILRIRQTRRGRTGACAAASRRTVGSNAEFFGDFFLKSRTKCQIITVNCCEIQRFTARKQCKLRILA